MRTRRSYTQLTRSLAALGALAAIGVGGVAVSGCGASATLDPIARAAEISSQQTGAKFSLTTQFASTALPGGAVSITANGYLDERDRSGEMTMDLSGIPGASALPGGGAGTVQMIFQYPVIYMNLPFLAGKLPEGKTWMELNLTEAAQADGIDLSQLSSIDETDPTKFLEYLRASSGGVTTVGHETVDGVPTTHYHATLRLSEILARLPSSAQAAAKAALEKLSDTGGIPVDVWVDAQSRVRRIQLSIDVSVPTGASGSATGATSASVSGTTTMNFTSYGPIPAIVPPPSGEVFDASSLAAGGLGSEQSG
jgi:hypothetical protein